MIYVVRYLLVALATVYWGTLGCLLGCVDRSGGAIQWVARGWMGWCVRICGVRIEADGLENVGSDQQPFVLMTNHQSVFDVAAIALTLPVAWRFIAKRELTRIPFFGWAMAMGGHIILDRSNHDRALASMRRAAERVRGGTNVIIFPEGTRSPSGQLGEFKSGGFHLAIQAGVPIVPATVSGSSRITPKRSLRIESGRVRIRYGRAIATEKLCVEDRDALREQVREAIAAGFDPTLQDAH